MDELLIYSIPWKNYTHLFTEETSFHGMVADVTVIIEWDYLSLLKHRPQTIAAHQTEDFNFSSL